MKRYLPLLLSLIMLTGCADSAEEISSAPETTAPQSSSTAQTAAATSTAVTTTPQAAETSEQPAEVEPAPTYVDDIGMLTEEGIARMNEVVRENLAADSNNYLGLFDFDRDTVPEVYLVRHTGNQGLMPVDVFSLDGDKLGSFEGYCRDGYCRLSYDDEGVYVHNSFEHSSHQSFESLDQLVFNEDGTFTMENIVTEYGYNVDTTKFPVLEYHYYSGETQITMEEYFNKYNGSLWEIFPHPERDDWDIELRNREANELSICSPDFGLHNIEDALVEIPLIYNDYINGLRLAEQKIGHAPMVYSYDDFDGDGICEAFILSRPSGSWYFYCDDVLIEAEIADTLGSYDFTRWGEYFIAQGFGNGTPCTIFGVKDGAPYTHALSSYGMLIRTNSNFDTRLDVENGIFVLWKSMFDDWSHTWKPYLFHMTENGFEEIVGVPVTREDFSDRPDVQAAFDEISNSGGTITGAYDRGGYLNINYTIPIAETDGPFVHYRYNTYYVHFDSVTLLEEGRGVYSASIMDN